MQRAKTALVTGGARGLGRETCLALSCCCYQIAINYKNSKNPAEQLAAMCTGGSFAIRADVTDPQQAAQMAREIRERFGVLDVIVNNAGVTRDALLQKTSEALWDETIAANTTGCANVVRACAPLMTSGGHIINITSRSGLRGNAGQSAYSASKAALVGMTRTLAVELAPLGIRVNALAPGYLDTGMGDSSPEARQRAREASLLSTLSSAKEAASFIAWLSGTKNITAQVFELDSRL